MVLLWVNGNVWLRARDMVTFPALPLIACMSSGKSLTQFSKVTYNCEWPILTLWSLMVRGVPGSEHRRQQAGVRGWGGAVGRQRWLLGRCRGWNSPCISLSSLWVFWFKAFSCYPEQARISTKYMCYENTQSSADPSLSSSVSDLAPSHYTRAYEGPAYNDIWSN